ncbi:UvrD-helicase domain-containing protein [Mesorhizobium sp. WSM2561]|uniref:UvrD-helicase domain-containing protein n=1 Tax=Mesorhizobium sp. WSM2561 TaxID=1040985 RepID=UPI0004BAA7B1|nr:UvrD-helicase domain-containing protein [Mesorhizobium sp. WSM2561]
MTTILGASFQSALARLSNDEQKQARLTAYELLTEPDRPGLQFHRIDKSRDPHFWSVRVSRDIRIIVHKTGNSLMLVHAGHHDDAYKWAERRVIDEHPTTGAIQIREVRELVSDVVVPSSEKEAALPLEAPATAPVQLLFDRLSDDELLSIGVPSDWLSDVREADEDHFYALSSHLPQEAAEGLLNYAASGVLTPASPPVTDPLEHPDTLRRFRVLDGLEELKTALDAPFEQWAVFLHPSQRGVVERNYSGPARVAGSAGTGKTVVALHRVFRILRENPKAKVLLTTFSDTLARNLSAKLRLLCGEDSPLPQRATISSLDTVARDLLSLATGREPRLASADVIRSMLAKAADEADVYEVTPQFLNSEWTHVIDAWQIPNADAYASIPAWGARTGSGQNSANGFGECSAPCGGGSLPAG